MLYNGYHLGGMHLFWWFFWVIMIIWIFFTPYRLPYQINQKDSPIDILKNRYASGEMSTEEYEERKKVLEKK